jgi:hypothetical protein
LQLANPVTVTEDSVLDLGVTQTNGVMGAYKTLFAKTDPELDLFFGVHSCPLVYISCGQIDCDRCVNHSKTSCPVEVMKPIM